MANAGKSIPPGQIHECDSWPLHAGWARAMIRAWRVRNDCEADIVSGKLEIHTLNGRNRDDAPRCRPVLPLNCQVAGTVGKVYRLLVCVVSPRPALHTPRLRSLSGNPHLCGTQQLIIPEISATQLVDDCSRFKPLMTRHGNRFMPVVIEWCSGAFEREDPLCL